MSTYSSYAIAGPSRLHTVAGVWMKKDRTLEPSSDAVEVVARVETSPPSFVTQPENPRSPSPNDIFVNRTPEAHLMHPTTPPPPYAPYYNDAEETWRCDEEPPTLARMLFIYGFFFFPFWLAGIYILCSPLLPTPDWEAGKTEEEKAYTLHLLRQTELKWARRCLLALYALLVATFIMFLVIKYGILEPTI